MFKVAALIFLMAAAVLAGFGVIAVMAVPALAARGMTYVPIAAAAGAALALPVSLAVAVAIMNSRRGPA